MITHIHCDERIAESGRIMADILHISPDTLIILQEVDVLTSYTGKTIYGSCESVRISGLGFGYNIILSKENSNTSTREIVLAHELIHVKQYVCGDLKLIPEGLILWRGEIFQEQDYEQNYNSIPWELEAYAYEQELYTRMLEWRRIQNKKQTESLVSTKPIQRLKQFLGLQRS